MLNICGGAGVGLVWGWLLGRLDDPSWWSRRAVLSVVLATLLAGATVLALTDGWSALTFCGATALAWLLHLGWRRELRARSEGLDRGLPGEMVP